KLVYTNTEDNVEEEVSLRLQGVLCNKDLPPLKSAPPEKAIKHLRQSITITGLGQTAFADAITNIFAAQTVMQRKLPEGAVETWRPTTFAKFPALDIGNRYFMQGRYAGDAPTVGFAPDSDPNGLLAACVKGEFVHTEENRVDYYRFENGSRPVTSTPSTFRVGDIVEITLSLVITPISGTKYRLIPILRSIALVDSVQTSVSDRLYSTYYISTYDR
ncbi:hypothetical protein BV22DRAFT_1024122, partial [Leucogyrophana mollusca]